jgi:hypothetical protein
MPEQSRIPAQRQLDGTSAPASDPHPFSPPSSIFSSLPLRRQSNRMAKAGLILAILVWPVGLILSVIALFRASRRGGAGWTAGVWGVLISVVLAVGTLAILTKSPAAVSDPGCAPARSAMSSVSSVLNADMGNLGFGVPTDGGQMELTQFINALQPLQNDLDHAGALATHQSVEDAIQHADVDAKAFILVLQARLSGDDNNANALQLAQGSGDLGADAAYINHVCAN